MLSIFIMFFLHFPHFYFIAFCLLNCSLNSPIFFTSFIDMTCSRQIFSKCFFDCTFKNEVQFQLPQGFPFNERYVDNKAC